MRHERLVAELASSLMNAIDDSFTKNVEQALERMLQLYRLDRISLYELEENRRSLKLKYVKARGGSSEPVQWVATDRIQWEVDHLLDGKRCHAVRLGDLPEEGRATRDFLESLGILSFASFPLWSGARVIGAVSFVSLTREVEWTPDLLQRLQTIVDLFSSSLDRKSGQDALRASKELNTAIIDSLTNQMAVIDGRGTIIAINKRWRDFWAANSCAPQSVPGVGTNYLDVCRDSITAGRDADDALDGIFAVLEGKVPGFEMDYECSSADERRWYRMHVSPLLRSAGAVIRHLDITSQREAELQLRESEARFRVIADSAPVMLWMSGTDKLCNYFNKGWLEFTGRPPADELGNGWAEGVHPDDLARCVQTYNHSFDARQPFTMEYRLRRRDGIYRWLIDNGVPRVLSDGSFAGYIGGCVDVTEQKEAEAARIHISGLFIGAQEQERSRIARELHDDINQRLALLAIDLQQAGQKTSDLKMKNVLEELCGDTRDISHDVQTLSHQLHSSQLQYLGLVSALRVLCREFSRTARIR